MDRLDRMDRMERMQKIERMESPKYFRDRRKHPRVRMDLPLEYLANRDARARGGIVVDASETGFLIYSTQDIPVGTNLKIDVLFPKRYELANFEVFGKIIWRKVDVGERANTYRYGLTFVQIVEEDYWKLKKLLYGHPK
jgi:PilZ domain